MRLNRTAGAAAACVLTAVLALALALAPGGLGGGLPELALWTAKAQRALHQDLAAAVRAAQSAGPGAAAWLIGLSFAYGVFHAAGPGHGKAVISAYLLTHESRLRRGAALAFASAFLQGFSALLIVWTVTGVFGLAFRAAADAAKALETASFALIGVFGFLLAARAGLRIRRRLRAGGAGGPDGGGAHGCGAAHAHMHIPAPAETWRSAAAAAFAVGARPCTGAVLVLLFAHAGGAWAAGAAAVMAMSLGTALTVSVLAALAVYARRFAASAAAALPDARAGAAALAAEGAALAAGAAVCALGASLTAAALAAPRHPLF